MLFHGVEKYKENSNIEAQISFRIFFSCLLQVNTWWNSVSHYWKLLIVALEEQSEKMSKWALNTSKLIWQFRDVNALSWQTKDEELRQPSRDLNLWFQKSKYF